MFYSKGDGKPLVALKQTNEKKDKIVFIFGQDRSLKADVDNELKVGKADVYCSIIYNCKSRNREYLGDQS